MITRRYLFFVFLAVSTVLSTLFTACASPPEEERRAAFIAMESSRTAGADKYAPADFEAARKLLEMAETELNQKKYPQAKQGYIDARIAFEKAAGAIATTRKALIPQAAAAVAALEEKWQALAAKAERAHGTRNMALWKVDSKSFLEGLTVAKELVTVDPAGALAKADKLNSFFEAYGEYFRQSGSNSRDSQKRPNGP